MNKAANPESDHSNWRLSAAVSPKLVFYDEVESTNQELKAQMQTDADQWPHGSVLFSDNQTSGKGRLGRSWFAPSGKSLAISVLLREMDLRPLRGTHGVSWLPLIAGVAVARAVRAQLARAAVSTRDAAPFGEPVVNLKWPNDVLISGYKVSGILTERLGNGDIIVGAGINLSLDEHDLPTITSTSLLLVSGARPDPDRVLADYLSELLALVSDFCAGEGDPDLSGIRGIVVEMCSSIGSQLRVELPGDQEILGTGIGIDQQGRLEVLETDSEIVRAVSAGDIVHLR